jgi:hypothetical protein
LRQLLEQFKALYEAGDIAEEVIEYIADFFGKAAVLAGGSAMSLYVRGSRTVSPDIDFLTLENGTTRKLIKEASFSVPHKLTTNNLGLSWDFKNNFNVDFIFADSELEKDAVKNGLKMSFKGSSSVRVIDPYYLFLMKYLSGRSKDRDDCNLLFKKGLNDTEKLLDIATKYMDDVEIEDLEGEIQLLSLTS